MKNTRLEAFSDAVFAVAITLLALDLPNRPIHSDRTLLSMLGAEWPHFAAYVVSFVTIGIIWVNHHEMLREAAHIDRSALLLNLLLLLAIVELPWATSVLATHLTQPDDGRLAAVIYAGSLLVMGAAFTLVHAYLLRDPRRRASRSIEGAQGVALRRNLAGILPYVLGCALAFVSPFLTVGACAMAAVYYAVHPRRQPDSSD